MQRRTLEPTWWVLDQEPGLDVAAQVGDSLKKMGEDLEIYPFQNRDGEDHPFLARFEFPKNGEDFQFPDAVEGIEDPLGFIDFLAGFPIDCIEMLLIVGEHSTKKDKIVVFPGEGKTAAPVPKRNFFKNPEPEKILLNYTAIMADQAKRFAKNLEGEPKPEKVHWWIRFFLTEEITYKKDTEPVVSKFPVPGEFLGLGVRMMPDKSWGKQKSSPFLYSGNWMDTVYYSGGRITEVIEPTDEVPYPTYKVQWRKDVVTATPTDFAEHKVGDRATVLKDVTTDKKTQLWKDDDMKIFGTDGKSETWTIAPITFYGLEEGEGG